MNGIELLRTGTVDVVENVFHDRVHSAWLWSVGSYLVAGGYIAAVAFRGRGAPDSKTPVGKGKNQVVNSDDRPV